MIHDDHYFMHYLLSLFNTSYPMKLAQLIHVFRGRRTPSMLYLVEKYRLFSAFGLLPKLKRQQLNDCLELLVKKQLLLEKGEGYILTEAGNLAAKAYFEKHTFPSAIQSMEYAKARQPLWERFQLLVQVFSERTYKNSLYTPVVKHPSHQEGVRIWLQKQQKESQELTKLWIEETISFFQSLGDNRSNLLVNQLAGHGRSGKTKRQVAEKYELTPFECQLLIEDTLEEGIFLIRNKKWTLLSSLLEDIQKETYFGLTDSTLYTAKCLAKGYSIEIVARMRKLKESTIKEHVLELALIQPNFSYQQYIPKKYYDELTTLLKGYPNLSYKEAREQIDGVEFLHYRLVQLEGLRENGSKY